VTACRILKDLDWLGGPNGLFPRIPALPGVLGSLIGTNKINILEVSCREKV
jgi:hypothetical protein